MSEEKAPIDVLLDAIVELLELHLVEQRECHAAWLRAYDSEEWRGSADYSKGQLDKAAASRDRLAAGLAVVQAIRDGGEERSTVERSMIERRYIITGDDKGVVLEVLEDCRLGKKGESRKFREFGGYVREEVRHGYRQVCKHLTWSGATLMVDGDLISTIRREAEECLRP